MRKILFTILILFGFSNAILSQSTPSTNAVFVFFDVDSDLLTQRDKAALDQWLKNNGPLNEPLTVECHCDSTGSRPYNQALSERRAKTVKKYLMEKGVEPEMVATIGKGKEELKYHSKAEFFKNRRCEFLVPLALSAEIKSIPIERGTKFNVANLQFVANQSIPMASSFQPLDQLLSFLEENPKVSIEIQGHVCCLGDMQLSLARAEMVMYYLIDRGIHPDRLKAEGYSNKRPLVKEVDDATRAINRRVEIEITSTNYKQRSRFNASTLKVEMWTWEIYGLDFIQNSENLSPTGIHNLKYIAEMLKSAGGKHFNIDLYEKRGDMELLNGRKINLQNQLLKLGVPEESVTINTVKVYKGKKFRLRNKDAATLTLDPRK